MRKFGPTHCWVAADFGLCDCRGRKSLPTVGNRVGLGVRGNIFGWGGQNASGVVLKTELGRKKGKN